MDKISFITITNNQPPASLQNEISAFMTKFPIPWEIVNSNQPNLTRAENLWLALQQAQGEYMVVIPADLSTPLADIWALLRDLAINPNIELILGNRLTDKKKYLHRKSSWHSTLENIILEKFKKDSTIATKISDPLTPYWALRKSSFQKILKSQNKPVLGWYYTPQLLKLAEENKISIAELPIQSQKKTGSSIPLFKEYLRHLF